MRPIDKIVVHCSDSGWGDATDIDEWHKARRFVMIGYHLVVLNGYRSSNRFNPDEVGMVERGRRDSRIGAHVRGYNRGSLGICYIGGPDDPPDTVVWDMLTEKVTEWCLAHGLDETAVFGHTELDPAKSCPCLDMDKFRDDVSARIRGAY